MSPRIMPKLALVSVEDAKLMLDDARRDYYFTPVEIAALAHTAAVLGEQRKAVLALHPRFTLYAYCEGDWNACDPSDSNHAESVYDGELMHLNDRIDEVCGSCFGDDGERVPYPCPTARAIGVES